MNVFNDAPIIYLSTTHAENRVVERTGCPPRHASGIVKSLARNARLFLEVGRHRYLRNGDLFLPCAVHRNSDSQNIYVVKSVLKWDMVEHRLQRIVDKYAQRSI